MLPKSEVAAHIAAAEKRVGEMAVICEILSGQVNRQCREIQEIKSAIACAGKQEERCPVTPSAISADMLAG